MLQGTFGECETIDQCLLNARANVFLAYEAGFFPLLLQTLVWEVDRSSAAAAAALTASASQVSSAVPLSSCRL